jgi:hypothetical protein
MQCGPTAISELFYPQILLILAPQRCSLSLLSCSEKRFRYLALINITDASIPLYQSTDNSYDQLRKQR